MTDRPAENAHLPRRAPGFTLIETLVAVSVLAIALTVILQLFSGGLRSARTSEDYTRGVFHAREKMEEILLTDLEPGVAEGEWEDSYRWQSAVDLLETPEEDQVTLPFDTYSVSVTVSWGAEERQREFQLTTLQMGAKTDEFTGTGEPEAAPTPATDEDDDE